MNQERGKVNKAVSGATYIPIFLVLVSMTFFGVCTPEMYDNTLPGIAATVGDEDITQREFIRAYDSHTRSLRQRYGEDYRPELLHPAEKVLDSLIENRALYLKAKSIGLKISDHEIVDFLNEVPAFKDEKGQFSEETFKMYLRNQGYSEASFMGEIRRSQTIQKLQDKIVNLTFIASSAVENDFKASETKMEVEYLKLNSDNIPMDIEQSKIDTFLKDEKNVSKVSAWYESHKSDYDKEAKVKASHILISHKGAQNASAKVEKRAKKDAEAKAQEILKKLSNGENFTDLAKAETDEPNGNISGGDLGYFSKGDMVKEFSDVAFNLKKGEISSLVHTKFGYHIIKVEDIIPAKKLSLEDATESIAKKIIQQQESSNYVNNYSQKILDALSQKKDPSDLLKKYKLSWQKTGAFSLSSGYINGLGNNTSLKEAVLKLTKKSPLHKEIIKSGRDHFILRLLNVQNADMSQLTESRKEQIESSIKYGIISSALSNLQKQSLEELERQKSVYKSEKYLALDTQESNY